MRNTQYIRKTSTEKKLYLRRKRNEFGMTQKQFAEILGLLYGTYRKYEESNSACRNMSDEMFEDVRTKIERYEEEHKGEMIGKIVISRYLEEIREELFSQIFTRNEREIANITYFNIVDIIIDIENRSVVPYLKVRK